MEGLSGTGREKQKVFPSEKQDERVQQYLTNNIELFHQNTGPSVTVCPFMTRYTHKMIAFNGSEYKQAGVRVKIYSLVVLQHTLLLHCSLSHKLSDYSHETHTHT